MRKFTTMLAAAALAVAFASSAEAQNRQRGGGAGQGQPGQGRGGMMGGGFGLNVYNLMSTNKALQDELKITDDQKKKLEDAIQESTTWLNNNQEVEKEEYEHKQKLLKEIASPIITKLYIYIFGNKRNNIF